MIENENSVKESVNCMENIILIQSGKGGVGKSTVAANLACCLSDMGKTVMLIDGDISLRNLDLLLGLQDRTVFDIQDLYYSRCDMDTLIIRHPVYSSLYFVPAPAVLTEKPSVLYEFIYNFSVDKKESFDYIIIDCPAGIGEFSEKIKGPNMRALMVATPDFTSVRDAEKLAMILRDKNVGNIRLIVNKIKPKSIKRRYSPDIDFIIDSISVQLIGMVPEDKKIYGLSNSGRVVISEKKAISKRAFYNIAYRICGENRELYKFW